MSGQTRSAGLQVVSEGPTRITRATIEAATKRQAPGVRLIIRDATCRGLALIVNPSGLTWRYDYRPRGVDPATGRRWPMQSQGVGTPATHGPEAARDAAGELRVQNRAGNDLAARQRKKIEAASQRRASAITKLEATYKEALPLRPKLRGTGRLSAGSLKMELDHLRLGLAAMAVGDKPIQDLAPADLRRLLQARAGQPATARKHFGAVSRFLDWCVEETYLSANPAQQLPKSRRPRAVAARNVCPSPRDLAAIWTAAAVLDDPECDFVRLLIAIPARLREVARMDWTHVDLTAKTWSLPAEATKTRSAHVFHLPELGVTILQSRHSAAGKPAKGIVLPSPRAKAALSTFTAMKTSIKAEIEKSGLQTDDGSPRQLPPWTFHDFRRAFASACAENGVAEPVADAILSHAQSATRGGVLGVYQRSTRTREQVSAMKTWNGLLQNALRSSGGDKNVVSFPVKQNSASAS
jgi:integrase